MNTNPIFIEYYPHEGCECYKVKNPWTEFREEKMVLCPVADGIERATILAAQVLTQKMADALAQPCASSDKALPDGGVERPSNET